MMTVNDIMNPARQTCYDHVQYSAPKDGHVRKPYQAVAYGGKLDRSGRKWKGPRRATARESAQDYVDWANGKIAGWPALAKLNRAGHSRVATVRAPNELRTEAYRLLAEASALESKGTQGYVYCISDGTAVKIGKTINHPSNRVASLQTGNPRKLELLATIEANDVAAAEVEMHAKFGHLSVLGEWFEPDVEIFMAFGLCTDDDA